jgi:hypothetical protein
VPGIGASVLAKLQVIGDRRSQTSLIDPCVAGHKVLALTNRLHAGIQAHLHFYPCLQINGVVDSEFGHDTVGQYYDHGANN